MGFLGLGVWGIGFWGMGYLSFRFRGLGFGGLWLMGGLFGIYGLGGFWFSSLCMVGAGYSGMKTNGVFYLFFHVGCLDLFYRGPLSGEFL